MALELPRGMPFTGKQGKVVASIKVNEFGQVTGYEIKNSFSKKINKAVLEAVKQIRQTWLPVITNEKTIAFHYDLSSDYFFPLANCKWNKILGGTNFLR
ncbi:MAG TPA: energy transducer TonB [Draconibacterium sp.]|nr:energy transducer TonB [Draconibacterium sp.]